MATFNINNNNNQTLATNEQKILSWIDNEMKKANISKKYTVSNLDSMIGEAIPPLSTGNYNVDLTNANAQLKNWLNVVEKTFRVDYDIHDQRRDAFERFRDAYVETFRNEEVNDEAIEKLALLEANVYRAKINLYVGLWTAKDHVINENVCLDYKIVVEQLNILVTEFEEELKIYKDYLEYCENRPVCSNCSFIIKPDDENVIAVTGAVYCTHECYKNSEVCKECEAPYDHCSCREHRDDCEYCNRPNQYCICDEDDVCEDCGREEDNCKCNEAVDIIKYEYRREEIEREENKVLVVKWRRPISINGKKVDGKWKVYESSLVRY